MSRYGRTCARLCERTCCSVLTFFPLAFVYGLSTWGMAVAVGVGFSGSQQLGLPASLLVILLYALLNWSYTVAVFTDPGSPSVRLINGDDLPLTSVTVKSTGEMRFCKKCQTRKPDRAHHCSTCRRCVLKMDHHCPWLATCVGLRNYKAFLLFLIYTSLLCWGCFIMSASWIWRQIILDRNVNESLMPVNYVVLSVVSGIIGPVVSGFTAWHLYLTSKNQTTLENLEKTRYVSPLRFHIAAYQQSRAHADGNHHDFGRQLRDIGNSPAEINANAPPAVLRIEDREERASPAQQCLQHNFQTISRLREQDRYLKYLDERDNERLPNAFDLGWRKNFLSVFGRSPWLWGFPLCNSIGDGWTWEQSRGWERTRNQLRREREAELGFQEQRERNAGWGIHAYGDSLRSGWPTTNALSATLENHECSSDEEDAGDGRTHLSWLGMASASAVRGHPKSLVPVILD